MASSCAILVPSVGTAAFKFSPVKRLASLKAWTCGKTVARSAYKLTLDDPLRRHFGLADQIRRAAAAIPANIAEGRRQESEKEFSRFLRYALNSSSELEYHLILAHDTQVISEEDFRSLVTQTIRVRKMLYALLKRLSGTDRISPAPARAHPAASAEPTAGPPSAPGR